MISGALRDRMAGIGVMVAAGLLLVTAWVLGVAAVVVLTAQKLGTAGALLAVTGGLVLLALILVWGTRARNRSSAAERATTRALWVATAVNAASTILRRDAPTEASLPPADTSSKGHRSLLLIAGGLVLILLAFLIPSGKEDAPASDAEAPDPEPDPGSVA
ncbi:MAG: hypothetical protein NTW20_13850 [Rhodobacterales bacterium]|nr:hypothetical protein [Rhodobacterales bacterium]